MIEKSEIIYEFKKSYQISYNQDYFCCVGSNVNIYDYKTGQWVLNIKDIKQPNYSKFTSNGNLIVKSTSGKYYIFDLDFINLIKTISPPKKVKSSTSKFQVTSDSKYIIDLCYIFPIYKLMIIDIETGKQTFFDLGYSRKGFVFSTECDSKYYIVTSCSDTIDASDVGSQEFYELLYTSGSFLLKKLFVDDCAKISIADYGSFMFALADYSNTIRFFDNQQRHQGNIEYIKNGVLYDLKISKNGRYVALAESKNIFIFDVIKKECVKQYDVEYGCFVDFLDDASLLIGTWNKGFLVRFNDQNTGEG